MVQGADFEDLVGRGQGMLAARRSRSVGQHVLRPIDESTVIH